MVNVLENCRVSVSPTLAAKSEKSLPLTFFDFIWVPFHPLGRVILFDIPCSTTHFTQNIVPNLKISLSHALKHFSPFAGNLIKPANPGSETDFQIRYVDGDSVSVTFAECRDDFYYICGNQVRDADILKPLVPQLPSGVTRAQVSGEVCFASPVLAIQVTVFPNQGVSFGFTNSHVVADGSSLFNFIRAWASFNKQVIAKADVVDSDFQSPYYDRSSLKNPLGLTTMFKSVFGGAGMAESMEQNTPDQSAGDKARAIFVLKQANIEALKNSVMKKNPELPYVSSFTVVCAYVWSCMAKTRAAVVEGLEEESLNFGISYDCRARLDPPLPASYFGNCIFSAVAAGKRDILAGEDGLFAAAELIGNALYEKLNNKEGVLNNGHALLTDFAGVMRGEWFVGIAGSPKLDYYNTIDFGWGKPRKFEFVSEPFSVSRCKDSKADLELGFILPKNEVDAFSSIFSQGLAGV